MTAHPKRISPPLCLVQIELKGRVPLGKLESFLVDLRHSRSRTVTLGLLRGAADATPDERTILQDVSCPGGAGAWLQCCGPAVSFACSMHGEAFACTAFCNMWLCWHYVLLIMLTQ